MSICVEARQLDHRRAVELAVVGGQPDLARVLDDGVRHLHLAVVEVAQRAVGLDARDADQADVDLELADEVDRRLADDAAVARAHRRRRRRSPRSRGLSDRIAATLRLLVITRRPLWCSSSRAIASVVVPMLRISEQPLGTARGHGARDARAWPSALQRAGAAGRRCSRWSSSARARRRGSAPAGRRRPAACTSRRTVCSVTPSCSASASTDTEPRARTSSSSLSLAGVRSSSAARGRRHGVGTG